MRNQEISLETLFHKTETFVNKSVQLVKLVIIDEFAEIISSIVTKIIIAVVVFTSALCLHIGIALWLGEMLGKVYYGFFLVAASYAVIGILLYAFRKPLIKYPLQNQTIIQLLRHSKPKTEALTATEA